MMPVTDIGTSPFLICCFVKKAITNDKLTQSSSWRSAVSYSLSVSLLWLAWPRAREPESELKRLDVGGDGGGAEGRLSASKWYCWCVASSAPFSSTGSAHGADYTIPCSCELKVLKVCQEESSTMDVAGI